MVDVIKEKERLTHDLTDQYSKSIISLEEYEGKIDMVNKVDSVIDMPKGKTVLHVDSIFGLTEILIPKNVRVINRAAPIMSGIFYTDETEREDDAPELYITGTAVFGNITIIRT